MYQPLTDALDASIPVLGVESRMFSGEEEYSSLDAMVSAYADAICALHPTGSYRLFGFSLGGYLAASVAERLEAAGQTVDFVGIADCPDYSKPVTAGNPDAFARLIASSYQQAAAELPFLKPLDDTEGLALRPIAAKLIQHPDVGPELLLDWMTGNGYLAGPVPRQALLDHMRRLARHLSLAGSSPKRPVVRGPLYVWQAARGIGAGTEVWQRTGGLAASFELVEADHATLMRPPALDVIAQQLNRACSASLRTN
jgi:thioesterase domain-containing protein